MILFGSIIKLENCLIIDILDHITCENYTDKPYAMICNQGTIEQLSTKNLYNQGGTVLVNEGTIKEHKEEIL